MTDRNLVLAKLKLLESAFARFKEAVVDKPNQLIQDAAIHRFEFTFELVWKTLKAVLDHEGVGFFKSPREVLKQAHVVGYVTEPTVWEDMLKARNITVHTYDEELANQVYGSFKTYISAIEHLITQLRKTYGSNNPISEQSKEN